MSPSSLESSSHRVTESVRIRPGSHEHDLIGRLKSSSRGRRAQILYVTDHICLSTCCLDGNRFLAGRDENGNNELRWLAACSMRLAAAMRTRYSESARALALQAIEAGTCICTCRSP